MSKRFDPAALKRVVIKIGSASIVEEDGDVRLGFLGQLVRTTLRLRREGIGVVLVSSGAIALGVGRLGLDRRNSDIATRQAAAAAGQTELMSLYQTLFRVNGVASAQVLLTRDDIEHRRRYLNAREGLQKLLDLGVVPIVNENDSVAVDEIQYGDNDLLSAFVAGLINADLLVMLTDVEGLFTGKPGEEGAELVTQIDGPVTPFMERVANIKRPLGSGGMRSKLEAAELARRYGIPCVIGRSTGEALGEILDGKESGTYVAPEKLGIAGRQRWVSKAAQVAGRLIIDDGAAAVMRKGTASLLPVGLTAVEGDFRRGAVVAIVDNGGEIVARGMVRYSADQLRKIKGLRGGQITEALGFTFGDEIVHRDDMAPDLDAISNGNGN